MLFQPLSNYFQIFQIVNYLEYKRKVQIYIAFILSISSSIAEMISLVTFVPLLAYISSDSINTNDNDNLALIINFFFKIFNINQNLFGISLIFIVVIFVSSFIKIFNIWYCAKLSSLVCVDISKKVYKGIINQPYIKLITKDKANYLDLLNSKTSAVYSVVNQSLLLVSNLLIAIFIYSIIIFIDLQVGLIAGFIVGTLYIFLIQNTKSSLYKIGSQIARLQKYQIKNFQENFLGIKDILMNNSQEFITRPFEKNEKNLRKLFAKGDFLVLFPKYFFEGLIISGMVIISYLIITYRSGAETIIPILGSIALGSLKIMPAIQGIFSSLGVLQSKKSGLKKIFNILSDTEIYLKKIPKISELKKLKFKDSIKFNNVSFNYGLNQRNILNKVNLQIRKGDFVGFHGKNGSGKSTLIELLMGLLEPVAGQILIDGKNLFEKETYFNYKWRESISYVPQIIFMNDNSLLENIAYGINKEDIDFEKIQEISKKTNISEFISKGGFSFSTKTGEDGVKLSGGQKQRIAIARALYKDSEILILDESSNNLDLSSEENLINILKNLKGQITIIVVSHNTNILELCDRLYLLENGNLSISKTKNIKMNN